MTDTILRQATQTEIEELDAGRAFAGQARTTVFGINPNEKTYFVGLDGIRKMPTMQLSSEITSALANSVGSTITGGSGGIVVAMEVLVDGAGSTGAIAAFAPQKLEMCIEAIGGFALDLGSENKHRPSCNERFWRITA